jgi:Nucleotidyltransferase/DNA polymerase involved in DNA repair
MSKNRKPDNVFRSGSQPVLMYVDMNSYFASCEQQDFPELRGKPIGVLTHDSPYACIIAPSAEAKKYGVKTGMRLNEGRKLCPHIIPTLTRPYRYRQRHVEIMEVLAQHCDAGNIMAKSIDEAVINLTSYKLFYSDFTNLALRIKEGIRKKCGEFIKCSIGIAPNTFLAKLATEIEKPDGLIQITPDNIDHYLGQMTLTDLPGIARSNERRLKAVGINSPLEMRHASESLLRKAFGGVVGHYWHARLNFREIDWHESDYKGMSATRTIGAEQRASKQSLESLLVSLCTRLEQRLVKQDVFCRNISFFIRYNDNTGWDTNLVVQQPLQDAMDMRRHIVERMMHFEQTHGAEVLNNKAVQMGVNIADFTPTTHIQGNLFDNTLQATKARKAMYALKDKYGKNIVRKASETVSPNEMVDAIGFGSVKDLYQGDNFNKYLLEEDKRK